jgi:hypothetical protein
MIMTSESRTPQVADAAEQNGPFFARTLADQRRFPQCTENIPSAHFLQNSGSYQNLLSIHTDPKELCMIPP